jgi:RNA polymerase sigma factor (TIGR02999 family)
VEEITQLLKSARSGDDSASSKLFELVYADLKRMARRRLEQANGQADLCTTVLVHESFVRLTERGQLNIADRLAFFAYVGRVMRNVVIDEVRARYAEKRGGDQAFVTLTTGVADEAFDDHRLLAVNTALEALERIAPEFHQLVEMRYFAGLSISEVAEVRGVSTRTVEREWEKARAFLHKLMEEH